MKRIPVLVAMAYSLVPGVSQAGDFYRCDDVKATTRTGRVIESQVCFSADPARATQLQVVRKKKDGTVIFDATYVRRGRTLKVADIKYRHQGYQVPRLIQVERDHSVDLRLKSHRTGDYYWARFKAEKPGAQVATAAAPAQPKRETPAPAAVGESRIVAPTAVRERRVASPPPAPPQPQPQPPAQVVAQTPAPSCPVVQNIPGISQFRGVAADPSRPGVFYAVGSDATFHTTIVRGTRGSDGEIAWSIQATLPKNANGLSEIPRQIQVSPTGSVYVTTSTGLYVSPGTGKSEKVEPFQPVSLFDGVPTVGLTIVPGPDKSYRVLVGTDEFFPEKTKTSLTKGEIYSMDDPSKPGNWVSTGFRKHIEDERTKLGDQVPPGAVEYGDEGGAGSVSGHIVDIQTDPADTRALYVGTGNHAHRYIPGKGWEGIYSGVLNDSTIYSVVFSGKTAHMASCNGLYKASHQSPGQPVQWQKELINGGRNNGNSPGVAASPYTPGLLVAKTWAPRAVIVSKDDGAHWTTVPGTSSVRNDHIGDNFQFLPDGTVLITGDTMLRVNALHPAAQNACGPAITTQVASTQQNRPGD